MQKIRLPASASNMNPLGLGGTQDGSLFKTPLPSHYQEQCASMKSVVRALVNLPTSIREQNDSRRKRRKRRKQQEEALETAESVASRWVVLPNAGWKQKWDT